MSRTSAEDREAILAMAGEYKVQFQFMETASLRSGYRVAEPYLASATEFVAVIEDAGRHIDLQHVLVLEGEGDPAEARVVKHWRQTWTYEDDIVYEYRGNGTWAPRRLQGDEVAGSWTQAVYQVDDSPRYEGAGRWQHEGNLSSWESGETWRPLPRREYTKRDDYHVLVARNRHTLTPTGWLHEQDNYKLVLDNAEQPILAREVGLNVYERTNDVDFTAGYTYWESTGPYWAEVRFQWRRLLDGTRTVRLRKTVDDKHLWEHMFDLAEEVQKNGYDSEQTPRLIQARLESFLVDDAVTDRAAPSATAY